MTSYAIQFLIFLLTFQAMTSSSRHTNSKKTTRLARMPIYFGKRSRKFPESSHGGTNDPDLIWRHTLYSIVYPSVTREEFKVVDGEYPPEMNGSSRHRNRLSPSDPWNCKSGSALFYKNKQIDTNVQTVSDSGRQNSGKTPGEINDTVKRGLEFKQRNFPTPPQYLGNINFALLNSDEWSDFKPSSGAMDTNGMKLILKQVGKYAVEYPLFVSPGVHKLSGFVATDPVGETPKFWGLRPSVIGHQRRLDSRNGPKSTWMRIEHLFKNSKPPSKRGFERLEDVTDRVRTVFDESVDVYFGREADRGKMSRKKALPSKRRNTSMLERMPKYYGKRGATSHYHSLEKSNSEPAKIWSPEEQANGREVLLSSLGAIDPMTDNRRHVITVADNF